MAGKATRVSFLTWRMLWPLPVAAGLWLAAMLGGLPHLRFSYEFTSRGSTYDPMAERHYHRCTYIGPYGSFTIRPSDGVCRLIEWRRSGDIS